jgi:hypothetical protein
MPPTTIMGSACTKDYQQPAMDFSVAFAVEIDEYVKGHAKTRYVETYDQAAGYVTRMCCLPPSPPRDPYDPLRLDE